MPATSFEQIKLLMRGLSSVISKAFSTAHNAKETAEKANANAANKMDAENPVGTGSFSLNRKSGTTVGGNSFAVGDHCTASGNASLAEGSVCTASGFAAHAEGVNTVASGWGSHAEGRFTHAIGMESHAEGWATIAHEGQHVQGRYNIEDDSKNPKYAHIVGNGYGNGSFDTNNYTQSNAHTLDWDGNAWFAGDVYVGGNSQDEGKKLLTEDTLPVATADTLGAVKVGEGLTVDAEGVLGVQPEGVYELLETININETVEVIVRTGLNLSKIYVRIVAPAADAAKYANVNITSNKNRAIGYFYVNVAQTYETYTYFSTEVEDGFIVGENCTTRNGEQYESAVKRYRMPAIDGELIYYIGISGANNMPVGTTIEIWGVRANA